MEGDRWREREGGREREGEREWEVKEGVEGGGKGWEDTNKVLMLTLTWVRHGCNVEIGISSPLVHFLRGTHTIRQCSNRVQQRN